MTFLSPIYLWGLLSLIPLAAIYLLKIKPTRHSTNAWFLWEKVLKEKHNSSWFSKLRHILSLILILLAATAVILSLAQPKFGDTDQSDLLIVIDNSASMGTFSNGSSRLDRAKQDAHEMVRGLHGDQRAIIASAGNQLHFHTHLSRNTNELHKAINAIFQSDEPLSQSAINDIAKSVSPESAEGSNNRVVLLTDGCANLPEKALDGLEVNSYFEKTSNIGIVNADLQLQPGRQKNARCMLRLASSFDKPSMVEVEIAHAVTGAIGKLIKLKVNPGVNPAVFFNIPQATSGHWNIRLLHEDALKADDLAHLYLQDITSVPVTTTAENSYFYQNCIEAFAHSGGGLHPAKSTKDALLTLSHGSVPSAHSNHVLVFAPRGESPYWSNIGPETSVNLAVVDNDKHPALRHIDINQFDFKGAVKLKAPENAKVLVSSDDGTPLVYLVHDPQRSVLVVNMDPELNDFYLSPWFPAIVYDTATFLSGTDQVPASSYPTGQAYIASQLDSAEVLDPSNSLHLLKPNQSLTLSNAGVYSVKSAKTKQSIAASLFSSADSLQQSNIKEQESETQLVFASPSFWLIILALAITIGESLLYHRRKAG